MEVILSLTSYNKCTCNAKEGSKHSIECPLCNGLMDSSEVADYYFREAFEKIAEKILKDLKNGSLP